MGEGSHKIRERLTDLYFFLRVEVGVWSAEVLVPPEPPVNARGNLKRTGKDGQGDETETEEEEARSLK